jgi:hypothetical protein
MARCATSTLSCENETKYYIFVRILDSDMAHMHERGMDTNVLEMCRVGNSTT